MKAPSNPFNYFISGSEMEEYTFEPGNKPFYVTLQKPTYIPMSVLIWANSKYHVKQILWDLIKFRKECFKKYISEYDSEMKKNLLTINLANCLKGNNKEFQLTIDEFKPNHAVSVGWASNDTIR